MATDPERAYFNVVSGVGGWELGGYKLGEVDEVR